MDYEGQRLSELLFYWIIISFGGVGWIIGYFQQDFTIVFQSWLVGVVISMIVSCYFYQICIYRPFDCRCYLDSHWILLLKCPFSIPQFWFKNKILISYDSNATQKLCVPDWPFYNRHPIKWLESVPDRRQQQSKAHKQWNRNQK